MIMKINKLLTILIVLLLSLAIVFVSCDKSGDETTEAPETEAPSVTDAPTEPADETTAVPDTAAPETTLPEETTEAPHVHVWSEFVTVKEPTCTESGKSEQTCACGEKQTREESMLPHTEGDWTIDKEATATETGSKHLECRVCKTTLKTEVIPTTPHTPGEWIVDKAATCTESGLRHRVCTKCGETTDTEKLSAKGHTEVTDKAKVATCTEAGVTEGKHCSVCNIVIKAQEKIPAKGHTEVTDKARAATCTENGATEGKHCSVCNAVLKAQESIPAKGHAESDWIIDKAATTSAEGSKHTECTVCKATVKTEVIPKVEVPKIEYTVTVLDGSGQALSGIEVVFTKAGAEVAKIKTDSSGKAVSKLESGEYEFALNGADAYYVTADTLTLSAAAPSVSVKLVPYATDPEMVYPSAVDVAPSGNTPGVLAGVYKLNTGSLRLPVEKDKMRYVFFTPTEGGIYRFYVDTDKVEIGYYGGSFFVYSNNTGTMLADGTMELKVLHSQIGGRLVIGYKSTSAAVTECTITIEKYDDIGLTLEELEWTPYKPDSVFEKINTPEGYLVGMDLAVWTPTDPAFNEIQVYYNEKDGYYHLESLEGPVLYVRINSKSSYQEALSAIVGTSNLGRYIYDENGEFVMKERYNEILMAYGDAADQKYGVYPLDSDLYYILKALEDIGWYDGTSPNSIFRDEGIIVKPYNGWLFACVYFK